MFKRNVKKPDYEGWAILEIMGFTKLAGRISEVNMAGTVMLRVDIPDMRPGGLMVTQYYSASSIFSITPCTIADAIRLNTQQAVKHTHLISHLDLDGSKGMPAVGGEDRSNDGIPF